MVPRTAQARSRWGLQRMMKVSPLDYRFRQQLSSPGLPERMLALPGPGQRLEAKVLRQVPQAMAGLARHARLTDQQGTALAGLDQVQRRSSSVEKAAGSVGST